MLARVLLIDIEYEMGLPWVEGMRREHGTRRYCITVVLRDSVHSVHGSTAPQYTTSTTSTRPQPS